MPEARGGLWRHPDFIRLWVGQTVSEFGSRITALALPLTAALTVHAAPAAMGLLAAAGTAPYLLIGLPAGVWVDRLPRRPLLLGADCARALLLLAIPLAAFRDALTIGLLVAVAFLVGIPTVFFEVAYQAFLPALVGRERLVEGNSAMEGGWAAAQIAGPGVAGALVQLLTAPLALLVDAASFLLSALLLAFVRVREPAPALRGTGQTLWREIGAGVGVVARRPLLRAIAGCTATGTFASGIVQAVYLLYVARRLGVGAGAIGAVVALGSVGFLVGATLAGPIARRIGLGATLVGAPVVAACGIACIPAASGRATLPLLVLAQFVVAGGSVIYNVNQVSLRQAITPDALLGRMNATMRFLIWGALPLGALLGGALGGAIGLRATLVVGALGQLLASLWVICSPVRRSRAQPDTVAGG